MAEIQKLFASLLSCWPLSTPSALWVNTDGCIMSFSGTQWANSEDKFKIQQVKLAPANVLQDRCKSPLEPIHTVVGLPLQQFGFPDSNWPETSGIVLTGENAILQNLVCHTVRFFEVNVFLFWWPS